MLDMARDALASESYHLASHGARTGQLLEYDELRLVITLRDLEAQ